MLVRRLQADAARGRTQACFDNLVKNSKRRENQAKMKVIVPVRVNTHFGPCRFALLQHIIRRILLLLGMLVLPLSAIAKCPEHKSTPPAQVNIAGDKLMIVVHGSSTYDARFSTKRGLDEAVRWAKSKKIPVIYLHDDTPDEFYFMDDCKPDHWVLSQGGELSFEVTTSQLYIVGGHLESCLSVTLHDVIYQWSKRPARNRTVTYLMDAIYSNGKEISEADPYWKDYVRFMDIVTYGRAGGEHWGKLTLLETMGIIIKENLEVEYLKHILPRWDRTFPKNYQVEIQLNESPKRVLRSARELFPPTALFPPIVLFHFVDSAINLN